MPHRGARQSGRRIDFGGGADDQQHVATVGGNLGLLERVGRQHFVEPDDVGPQERAACRAPRRLAVARFVPTVDDAAAARALHTLDVAVQLDQLRAAGRLVQAVDVLGDQQEFRNAPFDRGQRVMPGVGRAPRRGVRAATRTSPRRISDCARTPTASRAPRGSNFAHSPVCASRNVGTPDSAETPAPVSTAMERARAQAVDQRGGEGGSGGHRRHSWPEARRLGIRSVARITRAAKSRTVDAARAALAAMLNSTDPVCARLFATAFHVRQHARHALSASPRSASRTARRSVASSTAARRAWRSRTPTSSASSTGASPARRATSRSGARATPSRSCPACSKAGPPARRSRC